MIMHMANMVVRSGGGRVAGIVLLVLLLTLAGPVSASLVHFKSQQSLDDLSHKHILLNGTPVDTPAPSYQPGLTDVGNYQSVEDIYLNQAIAYSGSGSGQNQLYQHIYGYALPTLSGSQYDGYAVDNEVGHDQVILIDADEVKTKTNRTVKPGKPLRIKSDIILDGSLLLIKDPETGDDFEGLRALFDVLITQQTDRSTRHGVKTFTRKVLAGTAELIGKKNGKVKIKTSGKIKKKHISSLVQTDDIFQIDFNEVSVPYRSRVRVGEEFTIKTRVSSQAMTQGAGTGAEVIFGPGVFELAVPGFQENGEVPEPASMVLLAAGGLALLRKRKKRMA